jgi:sugar phosphate isomerase/epimerase
MRKIISLSPTKSEFGPLLFSGDLDLGLQKASELGYDGVEISLRTAEDIEVSRLRSRLATLNLQVYGIATGQTYYNDGFSLFAAAADQREQAVQRIKTLINLASQLGAMVIIGGIRGKIDATGDYRTEFAKGKAALREIARAGQAKGVTLLIEPINRYETNVFNTLAQGVELIDELGFPNLKILADTFHMNLEEVSINDALIKAQNHLGYVHCADSNRWAPGWGHLEFPAIIGTLKEIGYNGPLGIEVLPKPDDLAAAGQGIKFLNNLLRSEL